MKNIILILLVSVISGIVGYYLRDTLQDEKNKFASAVYDTARIAIYYDILKKYDEGKQEEAIDTLRGWLDVDIKVVNAYMSELSEKEQERVKKLLTVVEEQREKSKK